MILTMKKDKTSPSFDAVVPGLFLLTLSKALFHQCIVSSPLVSCSQWYGPAENQEKPEKRKEEHNDKKAFFARIAHISLQLFSSFGPLILKT